MCIRDRLGTCSSLALTSINDRIQDHKDIYDLLSRAIADQPALTLKEGRVIKDGFNPDLDELRSLATNSCLLYTSVMGCVVNGPGEAREADFGIAGGNGQGIVFRKGEVIKTVPEAELVDTLFREIDQYLESLNEESLC